MRGGEGHRVEANSVKQAKVNAVKPAFNRRTYMRDYMRERRAKAKTTTKGP